EKYPDIDAYVNSLEQPYISAICEGTISGYENSKVPPCRTCNLSADPLTTEFANANFLGENVSLQCVQGSTVLDVIGDILTTTGTNLLDGVSSILKYLGYGALALIIIVVIV